MEKIFSELKKFSTKLLTLNDFVSELKIKEFEKQIGFSLPLDYISLLRFSNGICLREIEIFGIGNNKPNNLLSVYNFEHYECANPMPINLVPFSPDGFGNHHCFELNETNDKYKIIFWQHDYPYTKNDQPDIVCTSLEEWINDEMISWVLEDSNYDGTDK